jgi:hypothetical protein
MSSTSFSKKAAIDETLPEDQRAIHQANEKTKVGGAAFFGAAVDKNKMTFQREQQRQMEYLALAEAFGTWLTSFVGRNVRGAEGFFEDVEDGVVLCRMLSRLGVPVEKPVDPPRNAFQAKENMQKFQTACIKSGFKCIPSVSDTKSLVPTLLEAAAVAAAQNQVLLQEEERFRAESEQQQQEQPAGEQSQKTNEVINSNDGTATATMMMTTTTTTGGSQTNENSTHDDTQSVATSTTHHKRKLTIVELPDALIKRTEDTTQAFVGSSIIAAAAAGKLRAHEEIEFVGDSKRSLPIQQQQPPPPIEPPLPVITTTTANDSTENIPSSSTNPTNTSTTVTKDKDSTPPVTLPQATTIKSRATSGSTTSTTMGSPKPTNTTKTRTTSAASISNNNTTTTPPSAASASVAVVSSPPPPVRVKRAPSEIPQEEKDRMVNLTIMAFFALVVLYLLFFR